MRPLKTHLHHAGCVSAIALVAAISTPAASVAEGSVCYWKGPPHGLACQAGHDCTETLFVDTQGKPFTYVGAFNVDCTDTLLAPPGKPFLFTGMIQPGIDDTIIIEIPGKPLAFEGALRPGIDDTLFETPGKPYLFVGVAQHDCIDTLIDVYVKLHAFDVADYHGWTDDFIVVLPPKPLRLVTEAGPSCTEGIPAPESCVWKGFPDCYMGDLRPPWTDGKTPADDKLDPHGWMLVDLGPSATDGTRIELVSKATYQLHLQQSMTDDPCHADINNDGRVDAADLHDIFDLWGEGNCPADCNSDGIVDAQDVMAVLAMWGYCP